MNLPNHPNPLFETLLIAYARSFPFRCGKLRVVDSLWRMAVEAQDFHRAARLKYGGLRVKCDLSEMLQRQLYFFGTYFLEENLLDLWRAEAKRSRVIFYVGANVGIYSLAALDARRDASVHAFEPTPEIAAHLRETAELNQLKRLYVHESAVSDQNGFAVLNRYRSETGANGGMNYISDRAVGVGAERVETVCLDQFCVDRGIDRIDLLKLDIQGNENLALKGSMNLLRTGRIGVIFMELNWAQSSGSACPATESIALLENSEYQFSAPGDRLNWRTSGKWMRTRSDIIARRVH